MITLTRSVLCVLFVAGLCVRAGAGPTGRVLVLDNEHTLEGDVTREGDQYRIRRGGAETLLPGDKVLCLCNNHEEAYQFLRSRANLQDPDERLRLARWCHLHNLRDLALAEAQAAVELRPNDPQALQVLHSLRRSVEAASRPSPPAKDTPEPAAVPSVECNPEALGLFSARVQPILMNTCVSCHAGNQAGSFKLQRVYDDGTTNRRTTQYNLAAVLAQLNPEHPLASPLLTKAVSLHGDLSQAPLKGRQTAAYRTLEQWVQLAVDNGTPVHGTVPPLTPTPLPAGERGRGEGPAAEPPSPMSEPVLTEAGAGPPTTFAVPPPATPVPAPPATREPADPFDPVIFNRQMHPQK